MTNTKCIPILLCTRLVLSHLVSCVGDVHVYPQWDHGTGTHFNHDPGYSEVSLYRESSIKLINYAHMAATPRYLPTLVTAFLILIIHF